MSNIEDEDSSKLMAAMKLKPAEGVEEGGNGSKPFEDGTQVGGGGDGSEPTADAKPEVEEPTGPQTMSFGGYTYVMDPTNGYWVMPYMVETLFPELVQEIHAKEGNFDPEVWKNDASKKPKCVSWNYEKACYEKPC
uniref:Uncharacterized protein n=1 Tax=Steinernema glaseri TaxID=37863 RepID=A0A1I8AKV7_9BILA